MYDLVLANGDLDHGRLEALLGQPDRLVRPFELPALDRLPSEPRTAGDDSR